MIVLHPGSRFLRIGRASDVSPVTVLNVIARKCKPPIPSFPRVDRILRPRKDRRHHPSESEIEQNEDEYSIPLTSDDPVCLSYMLPFLMYEVTNLTVRC